MAGRDLGEGTRLAAATGAWIVFEDEAGQNLRPPKARTWAPRGCTPVVRVSGKGSGRVWVGRPGVPQAWQPGPPVLPGPRPPRAQRRAPLDVRSRLRGLITAAHQHLHAPLILIWDNLNTHISATMRTFISSHRDWLTEVRLPAYAPDLNPVEGAWANMKNGLGNLMARNVDQLTAIIKNRLKRIQYRPALIDGFLAQTGLTLEPQPP